MSNNSENLSINHEISNIEDNFTSNNLSMDFQNSTQTFSRYLVNEKECSIESCLNQFTDVELMDGNNAVACKACTEREKVNCLYVSLSTSLMYSNFRLKLVHKKIFVLRVQYSTLYHVYHLFLYCI